MTNDIFNIRRGWNYKRQDCERAIEMFTAEIERADNEGDVMTATAMRAERRIVQFYLYNGWSDYR